MDKCHIFDDQNNSLMELSPMNDKRAGMAALSTDLGVIVVGGILENYQVTNRCELYNISSDEWKQI